MLPVALEIQHHVHHVLKDSRARNRALLGHMADQKHRAARGLCHAHQQACAFAHLRYAARRARHVRSVHRLNGVDDHVIRLKLFPALFRRIHGVFAENQQIVAFNSESARAHLDLPRRFLAGDIQHPRARSRQIFRRLQKQRRFADTRVAAHQHERSFHHAAAQHTVKLADAGRRPRRCFLRNLVKPQRFCARSGALLVRFCRHSRRARRRRLLLKRVPAAAARAFAHPARRFIAARAAYIHRFILGHGSLPNTHSLRVLYHILCTLQSERILRLFFLCLSKSGSC